MWKCIPKYEKIYEINNFGEIKSFPRNGTIKKIRLLTITQKRFGYYYITLHKNGKRKTENIHRLVAKTFIPNPQNKPQVNHIDGDKSNNNVDNLEWCTSKENSKHAMRLKLNARGSDIGASKLTEKQVLKIKKDYIPYKYSTRKLAKEYSVSQSTIFEIISNKNWNHI